VVVHHRHGLPGEPARRGRPGRGRRSLGSREDPLVIATVVRQAARCYTAGPTAADARARTSALLARGHGVTVCYWNSADDAPEHVAARYAEALEIARSSGGYLSVKATAVAFSFDLLSALTDRGVRVHFDAMGPEAVDPTRALIERLPGTLGTTLPGRWRRSDEDAEWAIARGLPVRLVRGQWAGPEDRDSGAGILELADRLAGRASHVSIATHSRKLGDAAIERLRRAGTSCELEQLYGVGAAPAGSRVYVPFGRGWLPYRLDRRRPHVGVLQLARDVVRAGSPARS
jgi:proline dehydrogenase